MPTTTIRTAPALDSFTPLAEHQSQTPTSFYSTKPVLYYHIQGVRAVVPGSQSSELPVLAPIDSSAHSNGTNEDAPVVQEVDLYVSSESLTLFNKSTSTGFSIPYPCISLHAVQRLPDPLNSTAGEIQGLYMQLELSTQESYDDEEPTSTDLTILPPTSSTLTTTIPELYAAVSACADLHPDPNQDSDDEMGDGTDSRIMFEGNVGYEGISGLPGAFQGVVDGSLPPPFPGSGGWITAENVHEHFDADGNFLGGADGEEVEVLGEGAGRVRGRDEIEAEETAVNGHGSEDDSKRTRTE